MLSDEIVIDVKNLSKRYEIYTDPQDRLKQLVIPSLHRLFKRVSALIGRRIGAPTPSYFREFWALQDISFQVKRGEVMGVLGLNGSGKSTLLKMICSTLTQTDGDVIVRGRISALLELGSGFNPEYTGRENVFLNGQILGLTQTDIEARYDAIVEFADIGDFINQPIKTYSSGMVVRLAFAVAVHVDPDILVVDEALSVGDMPFQVKCYSYLKKLREKGTSILFVTHDLATVRSFCDRAVYLEHGKCLLVDAANVVCSKYEFDCIKNKFSASNIEAVKMNISGVSLKDTSENKIEYHKSAVPSDALKYLDFNRKLCFSKDHKGSQSISIQSYVLLGDDGLPLESIDPNQKVTAYVLLRLNMSLVSDIHVSIQVHDRQGLPLMVVRDSAFETSITGSEGDEFVVKMSFSLPLRAGNYYSQIGVLLFPLGEKYRNGKFNFDAAVVADLVEPASYFQILPFQRHHIPVLILNESRMEMSKKSELCL